MSSTESAAAWSDVAGGWERRDTFVSDGMRPVTERLLAELDPRPGQTVLEVGAGLGEVGRRVAGLVGPTGRVLVTDQAPAMVETAARLADGLPWVEHRVLDAETLDLPDESVDGVVSRCAYMLVPDVAAGLAEAARVLRSTGRLAFSVWASATVNPWGSSVGRSLVALGLADPPEPDAPGPFRLADPERLRELVTAAGLAAPQIHDVPVLWRYGSFDEYWATTQDLAMSLRNAIAMLAPHDAARLRGLVEAALAPYGGDGVLEVPGLARVVATGR